MTFETQIAWLLPLSALLGIIVWAVVYDFTSNPDNLQKAVNHGLAAWVISSLVGMFVLGMNPSPIPGPRHLDPTRDQGVAACIDGEPRKSNPYRGAGKDITTMMFRDAWRDGWNSECSEALRDTDK